MVLLKIHKKLTKYIFNKFSDYILPPTLNRLVLDLFIGGIYFCLITYALLHFILLINDYPAFWLQEPIIGFSRINIILGFLDYSYVVLAYSLYLARVAYDSSHNKENNK